MPEQPRQSRSGDPRPSLRIVEDEQGRIVRVEATDGTQLHVSAVRFEQSVGDPYGTIQITLPAQFVLRDREPLPAEEGSGKVA